MGKEQRGSDWQVIGAVVLIAVGASLLLERVGGPWWGMLRGALRFAFEVAWPLLLIALGVLLLIGARSGRWSGIGVPNRRLYRSRTERMVGGVLGGLSACLGIDPTLTRVVFAALAVFSGFWLAIAAYVIALIIIPEEPLTPPEQAPWPSAFPSDAPSPPPPPPPPVG